MGIKEPCPDFASVAETAWEKARRRTEIIRKLVENPRRTKTDVREAVGSLGCSVARAYKLMARYMDDRKRHRGYPTWRLPPSAVYRISSLTESIKGGRHLECGHLPAKAKYRDGVSRFVSSPVY